MIKFVSFDVYVEETNTYTLTIEEFNKINTEYELGLDINNLSKDDFELLHSYLDDSFISDNSTHWSEVRYDNIRMKELI